MAVFLNSFTPLAVNKIGRASATKYNMPLFIDGSCRREPDFENSKPAITQLCRPTKLVTRLSNNNLIIYITKLGSYGTKQAHWKLISILEVISIVPDHNSALNYYLNNKIPVSQNIICNNANESFALDKTHRICGFDTIGLTPEAIITQWDHNYTFRANNFSQVAITKAWRNTLNINNPLTITRQMMISIFGRIPGTQNPPRLSDIEWQNFKTEMNL